MLDVILCFPDNSSWHNPVSSTWQFLLLCPFLQVMRNSNHETFSMIYQRWVENVFSSYLKMLSYPFFKDFVVFQVDCNRVVKVHDVHLLAKERKKEVHIQNHPIIEACSQAAPLFLVDCCQTLVLWFDQWFNSGDLLCPLRCVADDTVSNFIFAIVICY